MGIQNYRVPLFSHGRLSDEQIEEHLSAIFDILRNGDVMPFGSSYVTHFEDLLSRFLGFSHVVGVGSGTVALAAAVESLDLPPESEVVTSPFTFQATAATILQAGLRPVFADIDIKTMQLSDLAAYDAITPNTSAVLPVHLNGSLCHIPKTTSKCIQLGIKRIDDSAQRLVRDGTRAEKPDISCYSLGPTKNIVGYAEAGAVATDHSELVTKARCLIRNGSVGTFYHSRLGYNGAMDSIAAAMLLNNVKRVEHWNNRREQIANRYDSNLRGISSVDLVSRVSSCNAKYSIYVKERRDELFDFLQSECSIEVDIYYPIPLHLQPCFGALGYATGDFPNAESAASMVLSLPINESLTDREVDYVSDMVHRFFNE